MGVPTDVQDSVFQIVYRPFDPTREAVWTVDASGPVASHAYQHAVLDAPPKPHSSVRPEQANPRHFIARPLRNWQVEDDAPALRPSEGSACFGTSDVQRTPTRVRSES